MSYLLTIVKPDVAVFLNVFPVHTMQFEKTIRDGLPEDKKMEAILSAIAFERGRIITASGCKTAVFNSENKYVQQVITKSKDLLYKKNLLRFGYSAKNDARIMSYSVSLTGTSFTMSISGKPVELTFKNYILPREYGELFAAAFLVGQNAGLHVDDMKKDIEASFHLPPGRATLLTGGHESIIIDSSYNASREAVMAFLNVLKELKNATRRPIVFLFGDMRELGAEAKNEHLIVAKNIVGIVDEVYLVGPLTKDYVMPYVMQKGVKVQWFETSVKAGEYLRDALPSRFVS